LAASRGLPRKPALSFVEGLAGDSKILMVWVDRALHDEAMQLLVQRLDKRYSLCDAVSFVLMRRHRITDALSTDHHFEQEGFRRLLV